MIMTREELEQIIRNESLVSYNIFEERNNSENEIVIQIKDGNWIVYATDERASMVTGSEKMFNNESDALDNFIKRLRALNFLIKQ